MLRDNFTCCLSGLIDVEVTVDARRKGCDALRTGLTPVHIFEAVDESLITKTESLALTAELFQRIYECSPIITDEIQVNVPQNSYLAQPLAHYALSSFHTCLRPTEVPNRYCHIVYEAVSTLESETFIDFKDHTQHELATRFWPSEFSQWAQDAQPDRSIRGVPLPDATLLRGRAAMTMILHESGIIHEFDSLRYEEEEEVPQADGDSLMLHLQGLGYNGSWSVDPMTL
ncbi:hypothetical protein OH76DRAFT_826051 [Lentinus brumalis]|uniref:HNH nuclease domain-containing protein n=1 Tax=Lentinus brumalis TaxID=2498619 RepID=A0A371D2B8_9APHY|nr:hypothetical protein OH76DRAFT_826051 [Polyporus brumalis]